MRTDPNTTSGGFTGTSERRAHPRSRPQPFAYVKVGEHNGGIVMDASETGLQIAAANSLAPENIVRLSLQLDPSAEPVEVEARVVWLSESKKSGGFEFVSLTDEARNQIRKWLSGDIAKAQFSGPKAVPAPVRDQRVTGIRPEARTNGANSEIRTPEASDPPPPPRGLERMFPPEGEPLPPSSFHEAETHNGRTFGEQVPAAARVRDPAPSRANPISDRQPNPSPFHEREPLRPPISEARFPARSIFSDLPFQAPPVPQRRSNARMGLLTGVVMVICFAVGMISGRVWMGRWPQGWDLQELIGRASEPAPSPPAAAAPANPTANPAANPDTNGSSATTQSSSPPAVTPPAAPDSSSASSNAAAAPNPNPKEDATPARPESSKPESLRPESSPFEPAGSILVTAPAAGSSPTRISLPQEPLTASASVAIGIRRSALLRPSPGPVSMHRPERLEFGKIIAPVPGALRPNIPQWGDPIVVLRVTVGEQGEIKSLVPIRGRDDLIPTAERLVREWQQFPARLDGQPIDSTEEIILTFRTGP